MKIREATATDMEAIMSLLVGCELSTVDLNGKAKPEFLVAAGMGMERIMGVIGLEHHDNIGLLRSLAVAESVRNHDWGRKLVGAVEEYASQKGIEKLFLITRGASDFFSKFGYKAIARDMAPAPLKKSYEFGSLCPTSSVCMMKNLK